MIILHILLYVLLGILLFLVLLFSLHIKFYLKLDGETTIHAGLGPVVLRLAPKKPQKPVNLSDFTYEKHQKRLAKERRAALKKSEKKARKEQAKREKKALQEQAQKAAETIEQAQDEEKLASIFDILSLVFDELPKLASYFKTEIRMLDITVGGKDADQIARTYGKIAAAVPLLIELLSHKTTFKKLKPDVIHVEADFLAPKTTFHIHIRLRLRLFSILRIGFHALVWFIRLKIRQAKVHS
ncbi:MAG: hypothetical protein IJC71_07345 [Clostridia bacterium]|nr:hypothetical protein [Clostridia bacterium]